MNRAIDWFEDVLLFLTQAIILVGALGVALAVLIATARGMWFLIQLALK